MIKGFKEFIAQGNALELAVAVIIGAAFKPIVDAITKVIMTIIGQLIGQPNFDSLKVIQGRVWGFRGSVC